MTRGGIALCANVNVVANQLPLGWVGGRTALVICATTYPSACNLQMQVQNGNWVNVNAATLAQDGFTSYDLPSGQYRIAMAGGTVAGLYASLVSVAYT
jgi:hypothetical protein